MKARLIDCVAECARDVVRARRIANVDDDRGAALVQPGGDGSPEPAGRPGDDRHAPGKIAGARWSRLGTVR